jgi:autotransporter-associated beta strand protein
MRTCLALVILLSLSAPSAAALIAHDPFDVGAAGVSLTTVSGGTGFNGNWIGSTNFKYNTLETPQLAYPTPSDTALPIALPNNKAVLTSISIGICSRFLSTPLEPNPGEQTDYYFSFLGLALGSNTRTWGIALGTGSTPQFGMGIFSGGNIAYMTSDAPTAWLQGSGGNFSLPYNQDAFFVGKLSFFPNDDGNFSPRLRIKAYNRAAGDVVHADAALLGEDEGIGQDNWDVVYDGLPVPVPALDRVFLLAKSGSGTPHYDEIRIGTTWADVTGLSGNTVFESDWKYDADGYWNDSFNWTNGVPNGQTHKAVFNDITMARFVTVDTPLILGEMAFTNISAGYMFYPNAGQTLTLDNGSSGSKITTSGGSTGACNEIHLPVSILGNATFTVNGANLWFYEDITAESSSVITVNGQNTVCFDGNLTGITAAGGIVINEATLEASRISDNGFSNIGTAGTLTVKNYGALRYVSNVSASTSRPVICQDAAYLSVWHTYSVSPVSLTLAGTIQVQGANPVLYLSSGTEDDELVLAGTMTGSPTVYVSFGTLSVSSISDSGASNLGNGGNLNVGQTGDYYHAKLKYTGVGYQSTTRTVNATQAKIDVAVSSAKLEFSGVVDGDLNYPLAKLGPGTLSLTGASNNPDLLLNATAGTVELGKSGSAKAVLGIVDVAPDAAVKLTGTSGNQIDGSSNTGNRGLVALSGGTLDLNGHSESIGRLQSTVSASLVTNSASGVSLDLTVGESNGSGSFTGVIENGEGNTALKKIGAGTQILGGDNTYTGNTTIEEGILELTSNGQIDPHSLISTSTSGLLHINGGDHILGMIEGSGTTELTAGKLTAASITQGTLCIGSPPKATTVPEPSSWGLILLGLLFWRAKSWKKSTKAVSD